MINQDFKPIYCTACGQLIWQGICTTGFLTKLDPQPLTIADEIYKKIDKINSYELSRTGRSFEAMYRSLNRIKRSTPSQERIVLARHDCKRSTVIFRLKGQEPDQEEIPDYWNRRRAKQQEQEGIPF